MKIFITKKMIFTVVAALVLLSTLPLLQSCSNEDTPLASEQEYLDVNVTDINNLTDAQKVIFQKAKERIDTYVVLNDKKFELTIDCGSRIQISERLFNFFQESIKQTNLVIKDLNVVEIKPKVLRVVKKTSGNLRFKVRNPENISLNSTDYDVTWSGVNIYISSTTLNQIALGSVSITTISAMLPEPILSKVSAGILGLTAAISGYTAAECPNGIVIELPWFGFNHYGIQE